MKPLDVRVWRSIVLCDANVLYSSMLRDLIVRLGIAGTIRPRWTARIHDEWKRNLLAQRPDISAEALERTCRLMNEAVSEALLSDIVRFPLAGLPDPQDEHVLAAAVTAQASVLLTFNLTDFPAPLLQKHTLLALHPDQFFTRLFDESDEEVVAAVAKLRRNLKSPVLTPADLLAAFERLQLFDFVQRLKTMAEQL